PRKNGERRRGRLPRLLLDRSDDHPANPFRRSPVRERTDEPDDGGSHRAGSGKLYGQRRRLFEPEPFRISRHADDPPAPVKRPSDFTPRRTPCRRKPFPSETEKRGSPRPSSWRG